MKNFIAFMLALVSCSLNAQEYQYPGFYKTLYRGEVYTDTVTGNILEYRLTHPLAETDKLITLFDTTLLNDSVEIKYADITIRDRLTASGSFYILNGKPAYEREMTARMVVGLRFIQHRQWVCITDTNLVRQYLAHKNKSFGKRYIKHLKATGGGLCMGGVITVCISSAIDGFLLFGWHPYFVPVYMIGGTVAAIGGIIYINNAPRYVLKNIVNDYNKGKHV